MPINMQGLFGSNFATGGGQQQGLYQALQNAYDPNLIKSLYGSAFGNLSAAQGSAVNNARSDAGSLAYGRGLLNPSAFTTNAGSRAAAPYAPQFGQLATGQANALLGNQQDYFKSLFGIYNANRGYDLQQQQLNQNAPGVTDYLSTIAQLAMLFV